MREEAKVLITVPFEEEELAPLKERFPALKITLHPIKKGEQPPEEIWEQAEVLYTHRALPKPEQAPRLRWVQFHLAGVDDHLSHPLLQREDLQASTLSGANAPQVAEHALALMLALGHNLPAMLADQGRAKWSARRLERFQPRELYQSTVGIVGYGSVGQQLARLLQPFEATVLASKRDLRSLAAENGGEEDVSREDPTRLLRRIYPGKALRSMFKDCDFVVVALPLTEETRGMIGAEQLAALKPGAYLVDVSRGGVLDHSALVKALKSESFAGAALDVFPEEPLPADSPLWEMPNVIVSPHVAGLSPHYNARAISLFMDNLQRYLAGEEVLNKLDLQRGY